MYLYILYNAQIQPTILWLKYIKWFHLFNNIHFSLSKLITVFSFLNYLRHLNIFHLVYSYNIKTVHVNTREHLTSTKTTWKRNNLEINIYVVSVNIFTLYNFTLTLIFVKTHICDPACHPLWGHRQEMSLSPPVDFNLRNIAKINLSLAMYLCNNSVSYLEKAIFV